MYVYVRQTPWAHTDIHCVHIGIHAYVSVFVCVCVCIRMYTYIYEKTPCVHTNLHVCVYTAYMHVDFTCGCIGVQMYACVCRNVYIYVRRVYMGIYTYLHVWSPSLPV